MGILQGEVLLGGHKSMKHVRLPKLSTKKRTRKVMSDSQVSGFFALMDLDTQEKRDRFLRMANQDVKDEPDLKVVIRDNSSMDEITNNASME